MKYTTKIKAVFITSLLYVIIASPLFVQSINICSSLSGYVKEINQFNQLNPQEKVYWNPDVRTDNNGKANVSFYNNSTCRQVIINAEGINRGKCIIKE